MKFRDILLALCAPLLLGFGFAIAKPKPKSKGAHNAMRISRKLIRDSHRIYLDA